MDTDRENLKSEECHFQSSSVECVVLSPQRILSEVNVSQPPIVILSEFVQA